MRQRGCGGDVAIRVYVPTHNEEAEQVLVSELRDQAEAFRLGSQLQMQSTPGTLHPHVTCEAGQYICDMFDKNVLRVNMNGKQSKETVDRQPRK